MENFNSSVEDFLKWYCLNQEKSLENGFQRFVFIGLFMNSPEIMEKRIKESLPEKIEKYKVEKDKNFLVENFSEFSMACFISLKKHFIPLNL